MRLRSKPSAGPVGLEVQENNIYYVYSHVDPRNNETIYVGHGCRGRAWIHGSKKTCLRSQDHLDRLNELTSLGFIATDWVKILEKGMSKSEACRFEQEVIRDTDPTFNVQMGISILKVTRDVFDEIKSLRDEGMSYKSIGDKVGLSAMTVFRALNNQTKNVGYWK